jgi:xylulokinase
MKKLIGIDVGTTNVKAVLFDLEGNEVKTAYRKNEPLYLGQSRVEQDMNLLWDKVLDCLQELVADQNKSDIAGIGLSGQGEGGWLVDENYEPVSNAYLWNDGRAKRLVDNLIENEPELYEELHKHTGMEVVSGTALVTLLWAKENRKEELDQAHKLFFAKDWIPYKLTGEVGLEYTDAGTSLLNIETLEFEGALFDKVGLSDYKHLMSDIHKPYEVAGTITSEVAEKTGLPGDVPVSYGALDVIATTLGTGSIHNGDITTILGTTVATNIVTDQLKAGKENTRFEKHILDDLYIQLTPTMSGTTNIDWMYENLAETLSYAEVDNEILNRPPVPTGIIYHPYLNTSGERSPFYDSNARSSFFGVNNESTKMDLIKSVYEGIAFSIRDCLEFSETTEDSVIYLAGGGAASTPWKQIIADVTNVPVIESAGTEFAAKGAVMGMAVELGLFKDIRDAALAMCHSKQTFHPNEENAKVYDKFYDLYYDMRTEFTSLWKKRADILEEMGRGE